jgi:hypothetical protein
VRRPWFTTRPVDETIFETAPLLLSDSFQIPAPATRVWAELTGDQALSWCRILGGVTWTSPRPFGVGSTRSVRVLGGAAVFRERFFRWEEGHRHSFAVTETTAPLFRRFAEDVVIDPAGETACRLTWTIAIEAQPAVALANPINRLVLRSLFRDTRDHYGVR